jgi:alkylation response protein AidB-like acyl-CoA dehydrogenase
LSEILTSDALERDIIEYRDEARTWLAENLEVRQGSIPLRGIDFYWNQHDVDYYTPEVMAANRALQRKLFEGGYAGITWPKEYGGQGLPNSYEAVFREEARGYVTPDFGALNSSFRTTVPVMMPHASPAFLSWFIPKVLTAEILVCQFFSEPSAGSDLAGILTSARREGSDWVLSGQKIWSTFAHVADWGLCLARTDWDVPKHRGLTWFALPCDSPGLDIRLIQGINGQFEFCEDFFDDVLVPDAYRVGEVDKGWTVTQTLLLFERGAGRSETKFRLNSPGPIAPEFVETARRADRLNDPVVRQKLARIHTNDFVDRALVWRIGEMDRLGQLTPGFASYGKLFQGTYNPIRARLGVEIGGTEAMSWEAEDENGEETSLAYLNGRIMSIAGGTNEMQRNAISERVLGLPREPSFDTKKPFRQVLRDANNWTGSL